MFTPPERQPDPALPENPILEAEQLTSGTEFDDISTEEVPGTDVHTMPSKFLHPSKMPKKKGRISWIILGIVIFIVLGAVIVAVGIFLSEEKQVTTTKSLTIPSTQNVNMAPPSETVKNTNANNNVNVNKTLETPKSRDEQRLMDVSDIRTALNMYFDEQGVYPSALSTLLRDYLSIVPENPTPGGEEYNYQVNADKSDFSFIFTLEEGGDLGNLVLGAKKYELTAEGISVYTSEEDEEGNSNLPPLPEASAEPLVPVMGQDTDGDKLTDVEENLYKTDSTLIDTDGDGYNDRDEILGLFDPTNGGGAKLFASGLVDVYKNPNYNYSLLYPASWTARALTAENKEVIFNSDIGEFVEVIVQENPLSLSAYNWYINQNPTVDASSLTTLLIDNLPAVQSPDGLTTYLGVGSNIYVIAYNVGITQQMNFYTTYQLFLKTFMFVAPDEPATPKAPDISE